MAIYQDILQDILQAIQTGKIHRGEKLPSIRKLSEQYQCSKDTVQKAMLELKYQKKIYAVEKSGYYVLEDKEFQQDKLDLDKKDFEHFPYEDFRICINESLIGREKYLFNYYHKQEGLDDLLVSLEKLLVNYDVYAKKDQLVITSGSQQALYILTHMHFQTTARDILIEDPTYHRMKSLLDEEGLPYQTIERTLSGIDLSRLEQLFQSGTIKFFYTIPRLHNPLGTSYSLAEKKAIVDLAERYGVYIIEDDYLADFDAKKQVPLHYLDTQQRVIYIKSFTTTLFPALRIGGVVLPSSLLPEFLHNKRLMDYDTNLIMQKALSLYIDNGMFAQNTRQIRERALHVQEKIQHTVLQRNPALPYQVTKEGIVLQLEPRQLKTALHYSSLAVQVLQSKHRVYLILPYSDHFDADLAQLIDLLA